MLFECRGNRIVRIDEEQIQKSIQQCVTEYEKRTGSKPDLHDLPARFEQNDVGDEYYRIAAEVLLDDLVLIHEPRSEEQGETLSKIRGGSSNYADYVRSLDAKKYFAYFIVKEDSFEAFRTARKIARDHGLATGWHPHRNEES